MMRRLFPSVAVLCGLASLAAAAGAQPPAAPAADQAPRSAQPRGPQRATNLKVLPPNTDLRAVMHQYEADLGVNCEFCHAAPDPVTHRADRASDANPVKDKARLMIRMTDDLNTKYLAQLPDRHDADPVTCGTCHRGEKHPPAFVPAPRPDASRPTPAQPGAPAN